MKDSPLRLGITLFIIAGIMGLILGGANALTKDLIASKIDEVNRAAYGAVLPDVDTANLEPLEVENAYADRILEIYCASETGYAFRVSTQGYGGAVIVAVGIDNSGTITGIQILGHSETPGVGGNASDPSFTDQFIGKNETLTVVKGEAGANTISAISGATITSRSVTESVNTALTYFQEILKGGADNV